MAKDGLRHNLIPIPRQEKPVTPIEMTGLWQVYETQAQIALATEGTDQPFTPSHPKLKRAIIALKLPDIRTPDGLAAYKKLLEEKRQEGEQARRSFKESWRGGW